MAVELLLIGFVVIVVVAVVARRMWLIGHREEASSITEEQARENAAPLTTAILALGRLRTRDGDCRRGDRLAVRLDDPADGARGTRIRPR